MQSSLEDWRINGWLILVKLGQYLEIVGYWLHLIAVKNLHIYTNETITSSTLMLSKLTSGASKLFLSQMILTEPLFSLFMEIVFLGVESLLFKFFSSFEELITFNKYI